MLLKLLGFRQVRAWVWWPLFLSSLRQAAWLCAHWAKRTEAAADGEGRGVHAGEGTRLCFEGALTHHLDLDQGFQQGGGHMGTSACVYIPARVRLGEGWPRRIRTRMSPRLPPAPSYAPPGVVAGGARGVHSTAGCGRPCCLASLVSFLPQARRPPALPASSCGPLTLLTALHLFCWSLSSLCPPCPARLSCHLCWTSVPVAWVSLAPATRGPS